jgi:hypothetical protein
MCGLVGGTRTLCTGAREPPRLGLENAVPISPCSLPQTGFSSLLDAVGVPAAFIVLIS